MKWLAFLLFAFSAQASVTITANVSTLTGGTSAGAYILVTLQNCSDPTVVNVGTPIPLTKKFYPSGGVATITLYDNVTEIACDGNMLSYYTFSLVSGNTTTQIKNVELPPGNFNLANLANVAIPPFNPGIIQGPPGPTGPGGTTTLIGNGSPTATGQGCAYPYGSAYLDTSVNPNGYYVCTANGWVQFPNTYNLGSIVASSTNAWTINLGGQLAYTEGASVERAPHSGGTYVCPSELPGGGCPGNYTYLALTSVWGASHFANIYNDATDGSTSSAMLSRFYTGGGGGGSGGTPVVVPSAYSVCPTVTGSTNRAFYFIGFSGSFNDQSAGISPSTSVANYQALYAAAHACGYLVVLMPTPLVFINNAAASSNILAVNRAAYNGAIPSDFLFPADQVLPDVTDTDFYDTDSIHPNATGDIKLGKSLTAFLINGGSQLPFVSGYFTNPLYAAGGMVVTQQQTVCPNAPPFEVNCYGANPNVNSDTAQFNALIDGQHNVVLQRNTLNAQAISFGVSDATHYGYIQCSQYTGVDGCYINYLGGAIYGPNGGGSGYGTLDDGNGNIHMNAAQFTSIGGTSAVINGPLSATSIGGTSVTVNSGTNVVYRCTTAGTLPVGALTTVASNCAASVATALTVN